MRPVLFYSTCSGDIGGFGSEAATFFRDIGRRIAVAAGEPRSTQFLFQRLSIAIQRGNAASVVGTASSDRCLTTGGLGPFSADAERGTVADLPYPRVTATAWTSAPAGVEAGTGSNRCDLRQCAMTRSHHVSPHDRTVSFAS